MKRWIENVWRRWWCDHLWRPVTVFPGGQLALRCWVCEHTEARFA